jgi:hypothetical protein
VEKGKQRLSQRGWKGLEKGTTVLPFEQYRGLKEALELVAGQFRHGRAPSQLAPLGDADDVSLDARRPKL